MLKSGKNQANSELLLGCTQAHLAEVEPNQRIHQCVVPAWQSLKEAAKKEGLDLAIVSSFRSFERQLAIWNNKFNGKTTIYDIDERPVEIDKLTPIETIEAIMLFSALPGGSRHHWGTDIDVFAPNLLSNDSKLQLQVWEYIEGGPMHDLSLWLNEYAHQFGFYFPYDKYRGGVSIEPWHLSYGPIANDYQHAMSVDMLYQQLSNADIAGKQDILTHLPDLFNRFIENVGVFNHG